MIDAESGAEGSNSVRNEPSIMEMFDWLWSRKITLLIYIVVGAVLFWSGTWLQKPTFRADVVILPAEERGGSNLLNQVAGMAGFSVDLASSPEATYPTILRSHKLLDQLIEEPGVGGTGTLGSELAKNLGIGDLADPANRDELKLRVRNKVLSLKQDDMTGVMTLSARLPNAPELVARTANVGAELLEVQLGRENMRRAKRRVEFVGARLEEISDDLQAARATVTRFVSGNRSYSESPELIQRYEELAGEVRALERVWSGLREQYEMDQLEASEDRVSLDVLDRARIPRKPVSPNRPIASIFGALLGFVVGVGILGFAEARAS